MPKVLGRQRAGNKWECLYASVCWGGRGDFMFHSLPRAFISDSGIMEKCVRFASADDRTVLWDLSPSTGWLTTTWSRWELIGDGVSLLAHLWVQHPVDVLSSQRHRTVDLIWRKLGICRCVEVTVLVTKQRQRWANLYLYPTMHIQF